MFRPSNLAMATGFFHAEKKTEPYDEYLVACPIIYVKILRMVKGNAFLRLPSVA